MNDLEEAWGKTVFAGRSLLTKEDLDRLLKGKPDPEFIYVKYEGRDHPVKYTDANQINFRNVEEIHVKFSSGSMPVVHNEKGSHGSEWRKVRPKHQASARTVKKEIKMKNGDVIPVGTSVLNLKWTHGQWSGCHLVLRFVGPSGRDYSRDPALVRSALLDQYVTGIKKPSVKTMEGWMDKGVALTPTGMRTEPDGDATDGSPSWLLLLGYI